jgi:hypothetical protein
MDRAELKDRFDKLDDRAKVLIEKYPLVAGAVFTAGLLAGLLLAWIF